ncbi:hypothetical protein LTR56_008826 [Elasticomyces elasticus]|nr:hypothetical protein LTR22_021727 [Elasticomyces elasticus]KAK3645948.1 hypothetical protein LTR56_008826 [Elasticomyces elasticus]KAK4928100.1 hypothetical protein LTR49_005038 [Elasticomyces elasticus]KAK5765853.1 hypothetical protein LTS12_003860 [Elasticomyces elasticus]
MTVRLQQIAAAASIATGKNIVLVVKNKIFVWVNASDHQTVADPAVVRRQASVAYCFYALQSELRKDIYDRYFDHEKALRTTESGAERPPTSLLYAFMTELDGGCGQDERTSWAIRRFGSLFASCMHLLRGESFRNIEHMKDSVASITEGEEEDYRLALGKDQLKITYQREKLRWGSEFTIEDLLEGVRRFCERLGSLGYDDGFEGVDMLMREWLEPAGWGVGRPNKYDQIVDELVDMVED